MTSKNQEEEISSDKRGVQDCVHGFLEFHPLIWKVVDTPQFQRLRNILQMGGTHFVYPGATHNRFEHSLGTCHLAGRVARKLKKQSENDKNIDGKHKVTKRDIICVELAGLCHDLGHGPWSHMFDKYFLRNADPNSNSVEKGKLSTLDHETRSCLMFQHLIDENKILAEDLKKEGLGKTEIESIKYMMYPVDKNPSKPESSWCNEKQFLYEIVSNKSTGVDVDKWDYFARDAYNLGIANSFDHNHVIANLRYVKHPDNERRNIIAYREKESANFHEMFHFRSRLHSRACYHKACISVELMMSDAMLLANEHLLFAGKDDTNFKMSKAIDDMTAFEKITDHTLDQILHWVPNKNAESDAADKDMEAAANIIKRILNRDLYRLVGTKKVLENDIREDNDCKQFKVDIVKIARKRKWVTFEAEDIHAKVKKIDYGMGKKNPCDFIHYYKKDKPDECSHDTNKLLVTNDFQDRTIEIYFKGGKREEEKEKSIKTCVAEWCKTSGSTGDQ